MNAKNVLNRIITLLSKEEEQLATAKLTDGTIVESPSFDVEQPVEVVTEEGKIPAPDGEHELVLTDEEGNEILIKIVTQDGVIVSRENVDLEEEVIEEPKEEAVEEMIAGLIDVLTPDEVSTEEAAEIAEKVLDALEDKIEILKKRTKMEKEEEDPLMKMAIRIEELEAKVAKLEEGIEVDEERIDEVEDAEVVKVEDEEDFEKLPKLDGAPIEKMSKVNFGKKVDTPQSRFLSKLYK
jgi:hypothetical protein